MTMLLEASLKVFLLFLPFVGVQDLVRVLGAVRHGINVHDVDINDAAGSAGPQPMDQNIPSVFTLVLMKFVLNWMIWFQGNHRFSEVTGVDTGFVANR
jgi:hypothetical protein